LLRPSVRIPGVPAEVRTRHFSNPWIILKYNLKEQDMRVWIIFNWPRIRPRSGIFEHESSGSVESGRCLEQLGEGGFSSMEL
jgi:hypothetical protein